jgi:hypothetical protein
MPVMDIAVGRAALADSYGGLVADAGRLGEDGLARDSRCRGWTRADVLLHVLLDAQRALVALASPAAGSPDADFVSYWQPFRPGSAGSDQHAQFVRQVTAAYSSALVIVAQHAETAGAAVRAAAVLPAGLKVATQGHVLAAGDFLATLAAEATIHHLDLLTGDGDLAGPGAPGLAVVRQTLDGILGEPAPGDWDDASYALKGTGRIPLTPADRDALGGLAARFPLLG